MGFKEMVAADNASVFLNLDEFAEIHNLNGTRCTAILQDISIDQTLSVGEDDYRNLYGSTILVNCRKNDLPYVPVHGQTFNVDDQLYLVESVADDMGMLTIKLISNNR
ncbi:MAG: hypothetical protein J6B49_00900 [Phascolarctobacterium sp.]|nr:hypothetical protein [Phascolarctobacterium sp.]